MFVGGIAVSCIGDAVAGSVCAGVVEQGVANVFVGGKPVATVKSLVAGSNVQTGSPMKTAVASGCETVFVRA